MPKAIMVMGPPGSGKGTQAKFIADAIGARQYDTGSRLRELIAAGKVPESNYNAGKLVDPFAVARIVIGDLEPIVRAGESVVLSGSPRSVEEGLGSENQLGLIPFLEEKYGKENMLVFVLDIPLEESIDRNSKRSGNRTDDAAQVIRVRYEDQYQKRVVPVIDRMRDMGYRVIDIDGMPRPEVVSSEIKKHLPND